MRRLPLPAFLLFLLLPLEAAVTVRLRQEAAVASRTVCLRDIADVQGDRDGLGRLRVAFLGDGNDRRILSYSYLKTLIETATALPVVLIGSDVRLMLQTAMVDRARQERLFAEWFALRFPGEVHRLAFSGMPVTVVGGLKELVLEGDPAAEGARWRFSLVARGTEGEARFTRLVTLTRLVRIAVLRRDVMQGETLTAGDFTLELRPAGTGGLDPALLEGKKTAVALSAGSPVRANQLVREPAFRAGERINIVWTGSGIRISLQGMALESGLPGESIRVRNELTGQIIRARVGEGRQALLAGEE